MSNPDRPDRRTGLRDTRPVCPAASIFPNEAAIVRLVGAILMEQEDEWAIQRARDLTPETIAHAKRRSYRRAAHRGRLISSVLAGNRGDYAAAAEPRNG